MMNALSASLLTEAPAADISAELDLYAFLIGDWEMEATLYKENGTTERCSGEIHAGWVLEGRALQDVWILPGQFHGSTLRVYDPELDAWHILWNDPVQQYYTHQLGRAHGPDIVQLGRDSRDRMTRWRFVERGQDSFRWLGDYMSPETGDWRLEVEFKVKRTNF